MKTAKLTRTSIAALLRNGFYDATYYRYIVAWQNDSTLAAYRMTIADVLSSAITCCETVYIIPRD